MRIENLDRVLNLVDEAVDQLPRELFAAIGSYAAKRIQMKARQGRTMITGTEQKMPALSEQYIEQRKRWKKTASKGTAGSAPVVDPDFFSPARSNLTLTGQYLSAVQTINIDQKQRLISIGSVGSRTDSLTNEELSRYLGDKGRSIWNIDATAQKVIKQMVIDQLRRQLKLK